MTLVLGRPVPDFKLRNQHGQDVSLSAFRDQKAVAITFFPFAFSRTCTGELREIRDGLPDLPPASIELLAISCDPMFALRAFADAEGVAFSMLSDFWPHGEVARRYAVFDVQHGCALRGTFIVDRQGILRWKAENNMREARNWPATRAALAALDI